MVPGATVGEPPSTTRVGLSVLFPSGAAVGAIVSTSNVGVFEVSLPIEGAMDGTSVMFMAMDGALEFSMVGIIDGILEFMTDGASDGILEFMIDGIIDGILEFSIVGTVVVVLDGIMDGR